MCLNGETYFSFFFSTYRRIEDYSILAVLLQFSSISEIGMKAIIVESPRRDRNVTAPQLIIPRRFLFLFFSLLAFPRLILFLFFYSDETWMQNWFWLLCNVECFSVFVALAILEFLYLQDKILAK